MSAIRAHRLNVLLAADPTETDGYESSDEEEAAVEDTASAEDPLSFDAEEV
jgi:hypothetical protein